MLYLAQNGKELPPAKTWKKTMFAENNLFATKKLTKVIMYPAEKWSHS